MNTNGNANPHFLTKLIFDSASRLRSGWRFFIFFSLFIVISGAAGALVSQLLPALPFGFNENSLAARVSGSTIGLAAALLIGWFCARFLEDLPYRSLGASFRGSWIKDLLIGLVFGAFSVGAAILFAVVFGGLRFEYNAAAGSTAILVTLAVTFVIFTFGAAFEEALVRGYMFQTFTRSGLAWVAILLTSLVFAAGHLGNDGATFFSTANTAMAGIWLGVGYLKTRTLWFVFGLHMSWNWVQGSIFGVEVSGFADFAAAPLLLEVDKGPSWISGGAYGIEGGIACTIALIFSTALIWYAPFLRADEEMTALTSPPEKSSENAKTILT